VSTRTAGFNTIDISLLGPSMQIIYGVMMFLAPYPLIVTLQRSVDKEEKAELDQLKASESSPSPPRMGLGHQFSMSNIVATSRASLSFERPSFSLSERPSFSHTSKPKPKSMHIKDYVARRKTVMLEVGIGFH
jgi:hypothetical protein